MQQLVNEVRRMKYYKKGQKFYHPIIFLANRPAHFLRHSTRTADGAMRYGQAVLERYLHWCDMALSVKSSEASMEHQVQEAA